MAICIATYDIVNLRTSRYYDLLTWSACDSIQQYLQYHAMFDNTTSLGCFKCDSKAESTPSNPEHTNLNVSFQEGTKTE